MWRKPGLGFLYNGNSNVGRISSSEAYQARLVFELVWVRIDKALRARNTGTVGDHHSRVVDAIAVSIVGSTYA